MGRVTGPFFLVEPLLLPQALHPSITAAVAGLGYDLVDVERAPRGLMRVTIDHPWSDDGEEPSGASAERFITVDDCERVTRQLQHVLEVEGLAYERLEVSSPGLDRPIRTEGDFARFAGSDVELVLKEPLGGRKRWSGTLQRAEAGWRLVLPAPEAPKGKPKQKTAAAEGSARTLDFVLAEVRDAKLVPVLDFKGRRPRQEPAAAQEQESVSR